MQEYFDLGHYHRPITTTSKTTQTWFNRGLIWSYGFHHEEAANCFAKALEEDPNCGMAYWGVAYALGPNYNKPWEGFDQEELERNTAKARDAARKARECVGLMEVEVALVEAIQSRYQATGADRSTWNSDYAQAMEAVYRRFGEDLDVATLYADALMNLTPWSLWDLRTGKPTAGSRTLEAKRILERAMDSPGGSQHPGLLHLYIHLMEMSNTPESALPAADCLRDLVPDAGHLHHMPTHLDVLCGDYRRVISSNTSAIRADERWLARAGALDFYSLYRSHNYHFRIYGALFAGQFRVAMDTAAQLEDSLSDELLRVKSPPMADWLEGFLSMRLHVLVRFGRWSDILNLQLPQDEALYSTTIAMTHYAKGIALANLARPAEAEKEREAFHSAFEKVPDSRTLFNNTCRSILAIAAAMLQAELTYHNGNNVDLAFETFRHAIHLSDNLPYDEPWGWMQPPRHAYGALLLEQNRVEEAEAVYAADLGLDETLPRALQHPNNVWALQGLHESLGRLERGREARFVGKQLELVRATVDVGVESSCFCRGKGRGFVAAEEKPWRFNRYVG